MNNKELLFLFKEKFDIKTTEELGFILGQAATNVSAWQNNKKPMPMNIKFRLLEHINFSSETTKFAEIFVDIDKLHAEMQEDEDRIEEIKNKGQQVQKKYANQSEINRIDRLIQSRKINIEQAAKFLETTTEHLESVLSGDEVLSIKSKAMLYVANKSNDLIKGAINLMPVDEGKKKALKTANDELVHKNLNARLKK